jgi:DNA-binding response OmpR family regulator
MPDPIVTTLSELILDQAPEAGPDTLKDHGKVKYSTSSTRYPDRCGTVAVKPPHIAELMARLETVVRRAATAAATTPTVIVTGDVRVELHAREVRVGDAAVTLTHKEFELTRILLEHPGEAVSRQQLMDRIWGDAFVTVSRSLDVHMAALRAKLNRPGLITTIRGHGYRWEI